MLSNFGRKTMRKRNLAMRFADFHLYFLENYYLPRGDFIGQQMLKSSFGRALTR